MDQSFGAIVFRKNSQTEFLIIQHKKGNHWDFPKGHPLKNENSHETALREVLEETNYKIELINGFNEIIKYKLPDGNNKMVTYFLGKIITTGNNDINPLEIKNILWASFDEALKKLTYENSKNLLKKANLYLINN